MCVDVTHHDFGGSEGESRLQADETDRTGPGDEHP